VDWFLTVAFLAILVAVPMIQGMSELIRGESVSIRTLFRQAPTKENLRRLERQLEDESRVGKALRPFFQGVSLRLVRRGNEKVLVGRKGWLFYRPSLDALVRSGDLAAASSSPRPGTASLAGLGQTGWRRQRGASAEEALSVGPEEAIRDFHAALQAHGVTLILLPVPGKETIYPEYLIPHYQTSAGPPINGQVTALFAALRAQGVIVFDPTDLLWEAKEESSEPLYLSQDTHWSPAGMAGVARSLAQFMRESGDLPPASAQTYDIQPAVVENRGDLYDMLGLPALLSTFPPTRVVVEQVFRKDTGQLYQPPSEAPVLLLGDSYSNVFSTPDLQWGEAAGLTEHLAWHLGMGVEVIALNDGGVNGSRQRLARSPALLQDKQWVIWQFTVRDLTLDPSRWKRIPLRPPDGGRHG